MSGPNGELPPLDLYEHEAERLCGTAAGDPVTEAFISTEAAVEAEAEQSVPHPSALWIDDEELADAQLTPKCIVKDMFYADVAQLIAPGGVGKTTMILWEAIHIALKRPVWGHEVKDAGKTLLVTSEDQRERLVARMREMMESLNLSDADRQTVMRSVLIWDVTGLNLKLIRSQDMNIELTELADDIVKRYAGDAPVMIIFDPLVSFGVGEERVNGNEQGLVMAARRIVNGLECCVRFVHHTGKGNAREKTKDQYSGRGGSAMADGSRMTTIATAWHPKDKEKPPPHCDTSGGCSIIALHRAKLSYSKPNLPTIWLRREKFFYQSFIEEVESDEEARAKREGEVLQFVIGELAAGHKHTKRSVEGQAGERLSLARAEVRAALDFLEASGQLSEVPLPRAEVQGRKKYYLQPSAEAVARRSPHLAEKLS